MDIGHKFRNFYRIGVILYPDMRNYKMHNNAQSPPSPSTDHHLTLSVPMSVRQALINGKPGLVNQ